MSDTKPKRGAREPAQGQGQATGGDAAVAEVAAAMTAPVIERNIALEPDPVSTIALTQAGPGGPACPVPAAAEHSPSEESPAAEKSPAEAAETGWTAFA